MRITTFMLCNYVEVRESMLYIMGGSPEWWNLPSPPAPESPVVVTLPIALTIQRGNERRVELGFDVWCEASDQSVLHSTTQRIPTGRTSAYVSGAPLLANGTVHLAVGFTHVGGHRITLTEVDGKELARVDFGVRVADH